MSGKGMYMSVIDAYMSCLIQPNDHGWYLCCGIFSVIKIDPQTKEMAQWLKAPAILPEDLGPIPSPWVKQLITAWDSRS